MVVRKLEAFIIEPRKQKRECIIIKSCTPVTIISSQTEMLYNVSLS